jgi:hypothetical protein
LSKVDYISCTLELEPGLKRFEHFLDELERIFKE